MFQRIGANVYKDTKGTQVPELSLSFYGEFYLDGRNEAASATAPATSVMTPVPVLLRAGAIPTRLAHWRHTETIWSSTPPALTREGLSLQGDQVRARRAVQWQHNATGSPG